ncbi:MAG: insulinase family protein [Myxococcales bacterium]|nr:insulinase family protein [Myxococcales bacterium]
MKRAFLFFLLAGCATPEPVIKDAVEVDLVKAITPTPPTSEPSPPPSPVPFTSKPIQRPPPMHTIALPVEGKPIVSFRLVFQAGSIDDPQGKEGLTSLTAQLMAEGGTKELSAPQLLEALYPMAAELSASTDKELTVFEGRVHRDRLERFLDIFGDVMLEPRFDQAELDRLRTDALNAVKSGLRGENDENLGKVALDALLYPDHPYRHFPGGTVKGLSAITLEDVKAHWKAVFTQDRLVIGLAGAVDDSLVKQVKERLCSLPERSADRPELPPAPGVRSRALVVEKDSLSTAISMGFSYPLRRDHPDFYPVALAVSYLGEHRQFHGVLFQELREKRGLNYGDYAYAEHFHQEGYSSRPRVNVGRTQQDFSIWIRPVEPQNALFAARGAVFFLDELLSRPPPKERFETARGFLLGLTRLWEQTDQRRLGYAIDDALYGTPPFLERMRVALEAMTPEQMHEAARRHLAPSKLNLVFVAKGANSLAESLAKAETAPIRYPSPKPPEVLELDGRIASHPLPVHSSLVKVQDAQAFMEE